MEIGIFGLPLCGKTTLFTLLSGVVPTTNGRRSEASVGVARVYDQRVAELSAIYRPKKTTYATLGFVDLPSYDLQAGRKEKNRILQLIQDAEALLVVVRAFDDPSVAWPVGCESPARQLAAIRTELIIRDMEVVESRVLRLDEEARKRGLTPDQEKERAVLAVILPALEEERLVTQLELTSEELRSVGSLALLTAKPTIVAVNLDEEQFKVGFFPEEEQVRAECERDGLALIVLSGRIEAELNALDEGDRELFMHDLGIEESGIQRLSRVVYRHVGLVSFLTVGDDEVRAWTIRIDTTAKGAAGKIHTDLEKHFIRAEVIPYSTFIRVRDLVQARKQGLIATGGRDEIIRDGDIVNILANA